MKYARFLILAVFYTLYLVSPQILADSPREEAGKARREQLKNEHEFHKKMLEQWKEEQKRRLEYEREAYKNFQEMKREERKAWEEMEKEERKHYEEMLKESHEIDWRLARGGSAEVYLLCRVVKVDVFATVNRIHDFFKPARAVQDHIQDKGFQNRHRNDVDDD
jgi:hypothetical protein